MLLILFKYFFLCLCFILYFLWECVVSEFCEFEFSKWLFWLVIVICFGDKFCIVEVIILIIELIFLLLSVWLCLSVKIIVVEGCFLWWVNMFFFGIVKSILVWVIFFSFLIVWVSCCLWLCFKCLCFRSWFILNFIFCMMMLVFEFGVCLRFLWVINNLMFWYLFFFIEMILLLSL